MNSSMKRRNADYSLLKINEAFEPCDKPESSNGNIQLDMGPKGSTTGYAYDKWCSSERVTAPMALARLISLFNGLKIQARGQEAYKITWSTQLRHKASGKIVTFYDWKGGLSIGSEPLTKVPTKLKRDLASLLDVLVNERCPHPYDGCVVGEEA